jgi:hypothetical protein
MHETLTSANDPIFYSHHAFVDLLWEAWRLQHQDRSTRETDYPLDNSLCSSNFHFSSAYVIVIVLFIIRLFRWSLSGPGETRMVYLICIPIICLNMLRAHLVQIVGDRNIFSV